VGRILFATVACLVVACTARPAAARNAGTRLEVPARVATALHQAGFPARKRCGFIDEPTIAGCWLTIERSGYSVHVTPHRSVRDARVVYRRLRNPWAKGTRVAMMGTLVVSGFRVPAREWQTIVTIVQRTAR
jgi:hypothetical protein